MNESPDNPLSVLTLFDTDKKGLDYFVDYVANTIESGMDDPLKIHIYFKKMDYIMDEIRKRIKSNIDREAMKHPQTFELMGTENVYGTTSTRYDYSVCNDPVWNEVSKSKIDREAFLKALKEPMDIRIDDELVTIHPPKKITTEGIKTKIK